MIEPEAEFIAAGQAFHDGPEEEEEEDDLDEDEDEEEHDRDVYDELHRPREQDAWQQDEPEEVDGPAPLLDDSLTEFLLNL